MRLTSPAFEYGRRLPVRFTADAPDGESSPPLRIDGLPAGSLSLTLLMEDPDAPGGTWLHWLLFDLPPVREIPEGAAGLGVPGVNSWRRIGYGGPRPPSGIHRYLFRVFALDDTLRLPERSTRHEVEAAMAGRVLADAVLMARYGV